MDASGATSVRVLRRVLADHRLRRTAVAFGGFGMAESGTWVAVLVFAYERSGTTVAALVAVAQLLPAALTAPLAARVTDRRGAAPALRWGYWAQAAALAAIAALLLTGAADPLIYGAAVIAACAVTITRPAQAALLPALVSGPTELTAATVVCGWAESTSVLAGPALAGALIALSGPQLAIACFAALVLGSALLVAPLGPELAPGPPPGAPDSAPEDTPDGTAAAGALAVLRGDRGLISLVALLGIQYVVIGVLDVLVVVLADMVLGLGAGGAGYLTAAFGAGCVLGSLATVALIGRERLARPLITAAVGWAALLAALGAWPTVVSAFLILGGAGAARSLLDVCGRTMLLRAAPAPVRARLFGLLESAAMAGLALGSIMVPALVEVGGAGAVLIAVAALLLAVALAGASGVLKIERRRGARLGTRLHGSAEALTHATR